MVGGRDATKKRDQSSLLRRAAFSADVVAAAGAVPNQDLRLLLFGWLTVLVFALTDSDGKALGCLLSPAGSPASSA
jgi:hypothetical protein